LTYNGQAAGLPWDESSPLFGTTYLGGANNMGAVYEITPNGSGWNFQIIHSFSSGFHGGQLMMDPSGNLLGTTSLGGSHSGGTLFRLAAGTFNEATLHNFCAEANCTDGSLPFGALVMDANGNLFGTTQEGGAGAQCVTDGGCGVAYERTADGKFKVIHDFCSLNNCKDGRAPAAGMVLDANGNLFGTTYLGGTSEGGTVFELSHGAPWTETVLYNFCSTQNCPDGASPVAPPILDASGNLFGTTANAGANVTGGTAYRLKLQ